LEEAKLTGTWAQFTILSEWTNPRILRMQYMFLHFHGLFFLACGIVFGAYICSAEMFYEWLGSRRFLTFEDLFLEDFTC
jgi:hypothetical protein